MTKMTGELRSVDVGRGPPILATDNLVFGTNGNQILNRASLAVFPGETIGLIGPNGSGKTTLFNCLSGFLKPSSGTILFRDRDITAMSAFERARLGLGRVFQNFGIFRDMSVIENVVLALEAHESLRTIVLPWGRRSRQLREEALFFLSEVGLSEKAHDRAGSLSGGQMRLLEICRTLAFRAELFLLDEPTAGVSPKMKDGVADLIMKLQKMGKTILVIEHDIQFIQRFCSSVLVLESGCVVLHDTPERVRNSERLKEIYFGVGNI